MENKKHAYLVMAHNEPELLCKLMKCLDDERNDIFIHLDEKFDAISEDELKGLLQYSNITFIERKPIFWSGYSQIDCELRLLKEAVKSNYAYYHLISGVDLPIKSQDYIHNFFEEHKGQQFLSVTKVTTWKIASRYKYYHFIAINKRLPRKWSRSLRYPFSFLQACLFINRARKIQIKDFYWGQAWFSITNDFAKYIVDKEGFIAEKFDNGFFNDEIFMQTLLMNSEFKETYSGKGYARLIDWDRGKPYTWTMEEFEELMDSKALFSRKFSMNKDAEVIEKVLDKIM
ncbi:beta-1,6-N-acetylglucosaminyltransferase [Allomuricauda sp. NBRC 101325]|uniref:beta-1,6-N-acetylglucosaminyltransferase n=1 Tax=Allomuricauda sp. NBRC 101325 TaxID=1113758 RepID=UPI0024A2CB83|nr:beta-1,6-N-acetylglucosaminyltransferase [Muricauda sp. NBRC 101325]GLU44903.1 glycosyl transferase [Muricauda sp. NBRC 101325]